VPPLQLSTSDKTEGILHFYTSQRKYDDAEVPAAVMREQWLRADTKTPDRMRWRSSPALKANRGQIGGSMTPNDESARCALFTQPGRDKS
jgi:D-amino-acid dehydrogenase